MIIAHSFQGSNGIEIDLIFTIELLDFSAFKIKKLCGLHS